MIAVSAHGLGGREAGDSGVHAVRVVAVVGCQGLVIYSELIVIVVVLVVVHIVVELLLLRVRVLNVEYRRGVCDSHGGGARRDRAGAAAF